MRSSPAIPASVAVLATTPSLLGAAPTAYWLDSAEFAATAACLGIAHPPGHPVFSLLGKAASLLPVGDVAFRVNVLSAGLLGLAALALWGLGRELTRALIADDHQGGRRAPRALGARLASLSDRSRLAVDLGAGAIALLIAWSPGALLQGGRAEVYALHLACIAFAAMLVRCRIGGTARATAGAGLLVGLALANHHLLAIAAVPGLALLGAHVLRDRKKWRVIGIAAAATVAGASAYIYLPLRAAAGAAMQWGHPDRLDGFWDVVTARAFHKSASLGSAEGGGLLDRAAGVSLHVGEQLLWVVAVLGVVGIVLLALGRARRVDALGIALLGAGTMGAQVLVGFDPANPDAAGYLLPAVAAAGIGLSGMLGRALTTLRVRLAPVVVFAFVAGAVAQLPRAIGSSLASIWDVRTVTRALFHEVPTSGTLVVSTFRLVFPIRYYRVAEGWRPDVSFIQRKMFFAGQADLYAASDSRLTPLAEASRNAAATTGTGDIPPEALVRHLSLRPVLLEYDPWIEPAELGPARAAGPILLRLGLAPDPEREALEQLAAWEKIYAEVGTPPRDPETLRTVLWAHYVNATWAAAAPGHLRLALVELDHAQRLAPEDADLEALEARIRLALVRAPP